VGVPGRGTSCVSMNFTSGSDGGPQGSVDPWGHLALRLPWLLLHRADRVHCWAYLTLDTPSQRPDGGGGTRGIRPRPLEKDDQGYVRAKPDVGAF
jgi:hypothetical protein